jgi:hypothetical protein
MFVVRLRGREILAVGRVQAVAATEVPQVPHLGCQDLGTAHVIEGWHDGSFTP